MSKRFARKLHAGCYNRARFIPLHGPPEQTQPRRWNHLDLPIAADTSEISIIDSRKSDVVHIFFNDVLPPVGIGTSPQSGGLRLTLRKSGPGVFKADTCSCETYLVFPSLDLFTLRLLRDAQVLTRNRHQQRKRVQYGDRN